MNNFVKSACFILSIFFVVNTTEAELSLKNSKDTSITGHFIAEPTSNAVQPSIDHKKPPVYPLKKEQRKHSSSCLPGLHCSLTGSFEVIKRKVKSFDEKIHRFWKSLPNRIGYEVVTKLIKKQFQSIQDHLQKHAQKQGRFRREAQQYEIEKIKNIFDELKENTQKLEDKIEDLKETNPSALVTTNTESSETTVSEPQPTSGVSINNKMLSVKELLAQLSYSFNNLEHQNEELQHKIDKMQNHKIINSEEHWSIFHKATAAPAPNSVKEEEYSGPSTETLQSTISNFRPDSGVSTTNQVMSLGQLLAELGGVNIAAIQQKAEYYFLRGLDFTRSKIQNTMEKQENKIQHTKESKTKHAIAVTLHAILHFADAVAKPIVVLALAALVAGCIIGVLNVPVIIPVLMPIMQSLIKLISTLVTQLFLEWTRHPTYRALEA